MAALFLMRALEENGRKAKEERGKEKRGLKGTEGRARFEWRVGVGVGTWLSRQGATERAGKQRRRGKRWRAGSGARPVRAPGFPAGWPLRLGFRYLQRPRAAARARALSGLVQRAGSPTCCPRAKRRPRGGRCAAALWLAGLLLRA
jgi:hypothetical protein